MYHFGDHALTCRCSGLWSRHNALGKCLGLMTKAAGLSFKPEVTVEGKQRPADILIYNWEDGRAITCDFTIVHAAPISNLHFEPVGIDIYGGCGIHMAKHS